MFITSINLQNLELFEFMCVRALPNTSRMTLDLLTVSVDEIELPDKKSMACFAKKSSYYNIHIIFIQNKSFHKGQF